MADIIRKAPFKEHFVKDLNFSEFKVSVTGTVVGKQDKGFLLSDGTGEVYINTSGLEGEGGFNEQGFVKVFGRLMPYQDGFEIQAEFVQDMKGVDKDSLNKIKELMLKKV
tara:strand:- start:5828 stop:6157 length:330 start_codon:yes stop_codon:yes gene_type:complete